MAGCGPVYLPPTEEKDVQAQEPEQGLGHHTPSGLLILPSLTCLGFFFLPPESLCHLQPLGQWSQSSKAGPVDPGPIMGTHQVWGTDPLWAGVLALSLGQCTAARDTYTLQMMTG